MLVYFDGVKDAATGLFMNAPEFLAGDVQISIAGGAFVNVTNLPAIVAPGSSVIAIDLTAAEYVSTAVLKFVDQDSEWLDFTAYELLDSEVARIPRRGAGDFTRTLTANPNGGQITEAIT